MVVELAKRGSENWYLGAKLIEDVYQRSFGAVIPSHADELIMVKNAQGQVLAATGLRDERAGFFSQTYLDGPAETVISASMGGPVSRDEILEVVTLATTNPTAILPLLTGVAVEGRKRGKTCCLFTATARLRQIFQKIGMDMATLASADAARLQNADVWGRYYATDPKVCVVMEKQRAAHMPQCLRAVA